MTVLIFDEINRLQGKLEKMAIGGHFATGEDSKQEAEDIIDELLDLYLLAYSEGTQSVNEMLDTDIEPDTELMTAVIDQKFDGKDYIDRVNEYVTTGGTVADIIKVAESDSQRVFSTAGYDTAVRGGATSKTWRTKLDPIVRDTHSYIENVTVGIDERFYTFDGDSARFPGDFKNASNNANCRCELKYSK